MAKNDLPNPSIPSNSDVPVNPPSLVGISPEQLQAILGTLGTTSATAMREAIRSQRKENPNYPGKSVYNPVGDFDDEGTPQPPKVKLRRDTFFLGVRLSDELLTPDEIDLCNRFTVEKESRQGLWKAELERHGTKERLMIDVPAKTIDDRMQLPPFTHILRELLDGPDAVNPDSTAKRIAELEAKVKQLETSAA